MQEALPVVEFEFYGNAYLGSAIPEKTFSGVAARAEAMLQQMERQYQVRAWGEESRKMAICAIAECLYEADRRRGIRSANIGGVAVQYAEKEDSQKELWREVYRCAAIYLDIYRGAGQ